MNGKYAPLFKHLNELHGEHWEASFDEIEAIVGFPLPDSARRHAAWWANDGGHSHARTWLAAGWRTSKVDLQARRLVFERDRPHDAQAVKREDGQRRRASARRNRAPANGTGRAVRAGDALMLDGETFRHAARISPEATPDGKPVEHMPQSRYRHADSTPLNLHGDGPFCRFSVAGLPAASGVYAVTVEGKLVYVGVAKKSLRERWGPRGPAHIHPKNCFKGGQSTNCKVNHAILLAARKELAIDLWTQLAEEPRPIERRLIAKLAPRWNAQC